MARTSTYLNFMGNTEESFTFYKAVFESESSGRLMRMRPRKRKLSANPRDEGKRENFAQATHLNLSVHRAK